MAIVLGNQIINEPGQDFGALFKGAGNLFKAIGVQSQERQDREDLETLQRELLGEIRPLPEGQVGPPERIPLGPGEAFDKTLNTILGLRRPESQKLATDALTLQVARGKASKRSLGTTLGNVLRAKGISPDTATADDIKTATEDVKRGQLQQAVAVETAKVQAQGAAAAELPLLETNTTLATKLVRADNGGPIPAGLTGAEFRENPGAYVPVTEAQKRDLGKINASIEIANRMSTLVEELFPPGESRIAGAARRTLGGLLQTNPKVVEFNRLRKAGAGPMARALGEVGNLAEGDVDRAMAIWPVGTDSSEVALALVRLSTDLVTNMRDVTLRGGIPSDISGLINQAEIERDTIRAQDKATATTTPQTDISGLSPEATTFLKGQ